MSNIFNLNVKDLVGAVTSAVIVAILGYIGGLASIYAVDWKQLLNLAVLTAITSLLKSLGTDANGKLFGKIQVK